MPNTISSPVWTEKWIHASIFSTISVSNIYKLINLILIFTNNFRSFCKEHRIIQTVEEDEVQRNDIVICTICKENVFPNPSPSTLWAPCCKNDAWFHRDCIQDMAISAGFLFRCPLCNDCSLFRRSMLTLGLYIPSRDASWENVANAYAELTERPSTCSAQKCLDQSRRNLHNDT